ncbi:GAF and ANTAR domain-containing protein [soil metagenome]
MDQGHFARVLAGIAQTLITEYGIADVLYSLCDEVVTLLPVTGAGVMLTGGDQRLVFAASSDAAVAEVEALQEQLDEGPCHTAFYEGAPVLSSDLAIDTRFPTFAPHATAAGVRSAHAFPVQVHDRRIGALSLYAEGVVDLDDEERGAAATLASSAAAFVLNHRALDEAVVLAEQLQRALDSRVIIEQAKGKLGEQLSCTPPEAFEVLRRHSRNNGQRLADVSARVVDGTLLLQFGPHAE